MSLRVIVRSVDEGAAAHIGGPVDVDYKTFLIVAPSVEEFLRSNSQWLKRRVVGVEIVDDADSARCEAVGKEQA